MKGSRIVQVESSVPGKSHLFCFALQFWDGSPRLLIFLRAIPQSYYPAIVNRIPDG